MGGKAPSNVYIKILISVHFGQHAHLIQFYMLQDVHINATILNCNQIEHSREPLGFKACSVYQHKK